MPRGGDELIEHAGVDRSRVGVPASRDQHVDDLPVLVDRAVDVAPHTVDLDIGLIDEPPVTWGVAAPSGGVGHQRREPLHPSVDGDVVDLDAAFDPTFPTDHRLARLPPPRPRRVAHRSRLGRRPKSTGRLADIQPRPQQDQRRARRPPTPAAVVLPSTTPLPRRMRRHQRRARRTPDPRTRPRDAVAANPMARTRRHRRTVAPDQHHPRTAEPPGTIAARRTAGRRNRPTQPRRLPEPKRPRPRRDRGHQNTPRPHTTRRPGDPTTIKTSPATASTTRPPVRTLNQKTAPLAQTPQHQPPPADGHTSSLPSRSQTEGSPPSNRSPTRAATRPRPGDPRSPRSQTASGSLADFRAAFGTPRGHVVDVAAADHRPATDTSTGQQRRRRLESSPTSAWRCVMGSCGVIFKRCGCRDPQSRKRLEQNCPRLAERGHGSWSFHCSVTTLFGRPERVRRGGYPSRAEAQEARDELLQRFRDERTTQTWTVARWLRHWLSTRSGIRPSTLRSYTDHVERHLIPHLGRIRLGELTGRDIAAMFTALACTDTRLGRAPTPPGSPNCPPRAGRKPRCGPTRGSRRGAGPGSGSPWRCGPPASSPRSWTSSPTTGCSRCGG